MNALPDAVLAAGAAAVVLAIGGPLARIVLRRRGKEAVAADLEGLTWPVRVTAVAMVARVSVEQLDHRGPAALTTLVLIAGIAWMTLRGLVVGQQALFRRLEIDVADNRRARSRRTQIELIRRMLAVFAVVAGVAIALFSLTPLADLGASFVAYAGLIGAVLGLALRAPLENLAAGVIVAVSEPISIDDVLVVDGEWGRVEEIGLVNVVIRLWDDRRLVAPTSRFVNQPFENWTKDSARVTGSVTAWVDYTTDLDDLRRTVEAIVRGRPEWDGRFCNLQVVELGDRAVQVRILATAADASRAWDLRCAIREQLLDHLASRPGTLPVVRTDGLAVDVFAGR